MGLDDFGMLLLMRVRNIVNERKMVIVKDICLLLFMGRINIRGFRIERRSIGVSMLIIKYKVFLRNVS